jgi:hypothetical protein
MISWIGTAGVTLFACVSQSEHERGDESRRRSDPGEVSQLTEKVDLPGRRWHHASYKFRSYYAHTRYTYMNISCNRLIEVKSVTQACILLDSNVRAHKYYDGENIFEGSNIFTKLIKCYFNKTLTYSLINTEMPCSK